LLDETFFRWLCILHLMSSLECSYLILEQLLVGEPISDYNITSFPSKAYNVCTPKASDIALSYQKVTIRVFFNITCLSCNVLFGETRGKGMVEEKLEVSIVHGISYQFLLLLYYISHCSDPKVTKRIKKSRLLALPFDVYMVG